MTIQIISASAGSGKTTRLSQVLDQALAAGAVAPTGVVATTFTVAAATTLIERARGNLLAHGRGREAHQLLAARIGTVNAVCGALVGEFAFELGLSPALRVLDERAAAVEQRRALATVIAPAVSDELATLASRFAGDADWQRDVAAILDAARVNRLDPAALRASAARSIGSLDACLGPCAGDGDAIDAALAVAIDDALTTIAAIGDTTKGTAKYVTMVEELRANLGRGELRWGDWAKLTTGTPTKKSEAPSQPIRDAAAAHLRHPRLRAELHRWIALVFELAATGLAAYQDHKRERGLLDFVDQEALALTLLERADVRDELAGQLELVMVDEFQDTSPLQLAIFLALAPLATRSVWVGDQKQAIYGFRGTDPTLMDAAIESLTGTSTDPELLGAAVAALGHAGTLETLEVSYRSRPALVTLTSALFARAFAGQGIPAERTVLRPHLEVEPPGLGPIVEHWPLGGRNADHTAAAAAAGVRALLDEETLVRDTGQAAGAASRPIRARARDLAVLCRTNKQCQAIADALAELGIPAVLPRMGLLATAEGLLVGAALRLWLDPRDGVAAATLARLTTFVDDLEGLVGHALATPGAAAFAEAPIIMALTAARAAAPELDPLGVIDAVMTATDLRARVAGWPNPAQRLANLDALRGHAVSYLEDAAANRQPPTLLGLIGHLDDLADGDPGPMWTRSPRDEQAVPGGADAVTVSTWHRAKGREWPVTILFGLERVREASATGLHVESDRPFDLAAPLAGRWLRYWPDPYTVPIQGGPVREAFARSAEHAAAAARAERELLRLLYVGWTRARDRLVLAASAGKLTAGIARGLADQLEEPAPEAGVIDTSWGGLRLRLRVRPLEARAPLGPVIAAGETYLPRAPVAHPPARRSPSDAAPRPCTLGAPVVLGGRLPFRHQPAATAEADLMEHLGRAIHAVFAADRDDLTEDARIAIAAGLLDRHRVAGIVAPIDVAIAAGRLRDWAAQLGATRLHREWPIAAPQPDGALLSGTADLVLRTPAGLIVVDHKTFPGDLERALRRIPEHAGQLAAYAEAIAAATGAPVIGTWIHLPILGVAVEVKVAA